MKPRIQSKVVIDTVAHAIVIHDQIVSHIVGRDIFETHELLHSIDEEGRVVCLVDIRFNSRADRDELLDWIKQQVQDNPVVRTWVLTAEVSVHDCRHDEVTVYEQGDCKRTRVVWQRA